MWDYISNLDFEALSNDTRIKKSDLIKICSQKSKQNLANIIEKQARIMFMLAVWLWHISFPLYTHLHIYTTFPGRLFTLKF